MDRGWGADLARIEEAEEVEVHCCLNHLSIPGVLLEQVWQRGLGPTQNARRFLQAWVSWKLL